MKLSTFARPKVWIPLVVVIVVIAGGVAYARRSSPPTYTTAVAAVMDLVQQTSVTGRVKPIENVDLAFEKVGRVDAVHANIGDHVRAGTVLIHLDVSELEAQRAQADASFENAVAQLRQLTQAQAREQSALDELKRGTRPEELAIATTNVETAQKALDDARVSLSAVEAKARIDLNNLYSGIGDILSDAYTKADDATNKQIDELFDNDATAQPTLTFATDGQRAIDAQSQRVIAGKMLAAFKDDLAKNPLPSNALDQALSRLRPIAALFDTLNDAVSLATNLSLSTRSTYKANVNTARANLNTAVAAMNKQQQLISAQEAGNENATSAAQAQLNDAQGALDAARAQLSLKVAGATSEQIAQQTARLDQAEASVSGQAALVKVAAAQRAQVEAQIAQRALLAPIDGVVTRQDARVGAIVAVNVPVASMMSDGKLEIEAQTPEADIANVKVGAAATVTLDAYPADVVFHAHVVSIDPSETIVDGVATYKTTLSFVEDDPRIKSGMTANVEMIGATREHVIAIPSRAVTSDGQTKRVRRLRGQTPEDVEVKTGLIDSNGNVEVIDGLQAGDVIIVS